VACPAGCNRPASAESRHRGRILCGIDRSVTGREIPLRSPAHAPIFTVLAVPLAGWLSRHQQQVLEFRREENRVLKAQLGRPKLRLSDDDRVRGAVRGIVLRRKLLDEFASLVTPETILRWHPKR
jgi:hypothetical protein